MMPNALKIFNKMCGCIRMPFSMWEAAPRATLIDKDCIVYCGIKQGVLIWVTPAARTAVQKNGWLAFW